MDRHTKYDISKLVSNLMTLLITSSFNYIFLLSASEVFFGSMYFRETWSKSNRIRRLITNITINLICLFYPQSTDQFGCHIKNHLYERSDIIVKMTRKTNTRTTQTRTAGNYNNYMRKIIIECGWNLTTKISSVMITMNIKILMLM